MSLELAPITIDALRHHFKSVYKLNEEQINLVIASSSRSLLSAIKSFDEVDEDENIYEKIKAISHGMKGVLLNMGQHEWADFAREIEKAANAGESRDYKEMVRQLRKGVQDIFSISQL